MSKKLTLQDIKNCLNIDDEHLFSLGYCYDNIYGEDELINGDSSSEDEADFDPEIERNAILIIRKPAISIHRPLDKYLIETIT